MTEPSRLFDFIYHQQQQYPLEQSFGHQLQNEWVYYSTDEMIDLANKVSCGLLKLGFKEGDRIGIISYKNRPEWTIVDIGIQQAGMIPIPVYPTISPREYTYIFNDATVKYCFVGGGDLLKKVTLATQDMPAFKGIASFDQQEGCPHWESIFTLEGLDQVKATMAKIKATDLATIIYTSGTTGNPKGVMLSHQNIGSNVQAVKKVFPVGHGAKALSFLPLCHIFERTASYAYMNLGIKVVYTGTDNLGGDSGDLKAVKPNFFTTVPRLLEKVYEKIYNRGLALTGAKRSLFFWALKLAEKYEYDFQPRGWNAVKWSVADRLIFSKWREALGGEIKGILTGAAPCPEKVSRLFSAAGIPIREGYGLTETSPGIAIGRFEPKGALIGTIGPLLDDIEVRIDPEGDFREGEGEILTHGPNVMMGYANLEQKTNEVIVELDGKRWFRTGDVGKFVKGPNGEPFLKITDRKKELLKTSGGKYVAPAPIENKFKEDFLIEQIMVIGEKRKFVSALIVPAVDALKDWCEQNDVEWTDLQQVLDNPKVVNCYQNIINQYNPLFSHIEQIKKFRLLSAEWLPICPDGSAAELTPTMKLKRRVIREKYQSEIEEIYT